MDHKLLSKVKVKAALEILTINSNIKLDFLESFA
jgi:hypothetical protein